MKSIRLNRFVHLLQCLLTDFPILEDDVQLLYHCVVSTLMNGKNFYDEEGKALLICRLWACACDGCWNWQNHIETLWGGFLFISEQDIVPPDQQREPQPDNGNEPVWRETKAISLLPINQLGQHESSTKPVVTPSAHPVTASHFSCHPGQHFSPKSLLTTVQNAIKQVRGGLSVRETSPKAVLAPWQIPQTAFHRVIHHPQRAPNSHLSLIPATHALKQSLRPLNYQLSRGKNHGKAFPRAIIPNRLQENQGHWRSLCPTTPAINRQEKHRASCRPLPQHEQW